jgi:hypothetical protein
MEGFPQGSKAEGHPIYISGEYGLELDWCDSEYGVATCPPPETDEFYSDWLDELDLYEQVAALYPEEA